MSDSAADHAPSAQDGLVARGGAQARPASRRRTDGAELLILDALVHSRERRAIGQPSNLERVDARATDLGGLERTTLLVRLPGEEALVVHGSETLVLPRGEVADLPERALAAAAAWRHERHRLERRVRSADWLMLFMDELDAAKGAEDVFRAVLRCARGVTEVFGAIVYTPEPGPQDGGLRPVQEPGGELPAPPIDATLPDPATGMAVLSDLEANGGSSGVARVLEPLFPAVGATQLLSVPFHDRALLVLVERRRDRVFTAAERDVLGWIVRQAERSLLHGIAESPG